MPTGIIWQTVTYIRSGQPYQKIDLVSVSLLLLAEVYAFLELYLGFFQTVQPLRRAPVPLPADPSQWPAVDASFQLTTKILTWFATPSSPL